MKYINIVRQLLLILQLIPTLLLAQANNKILTKETSLLVHFLKSKHISPRPIDKQLGIDVLDKMLNSLDDQQLYFRETDIIKLKKLSYQLPKDFSSNGSSFIDTFKLILKERLSPLPEQIGKYLNTVPIYASTEIIKSLKQDSLSWAKNNTEAEKKWKMYLRYQILWHWLSQLDSSVISDESAKLNFNQNEKRIREKISLLEQRKIKRILSSPVGFEKHIENIYLNAIANCFDPHTTYMSKAEYESFQTTISTESVSLGLEFQEDEQGDIYIEKIYPGGPAWRSNSLNKGDFLIGVKLNDKNYDLVGAELQEVENIINTSANNVIELHIRKVNGSTTKVSLVKEKLKEEDNSIKSFVLKGTEKIGYISLPAFYSEWENSSSNGCANDVAKEIIKLKTENIKGLILDIRNNGGGSLKEGIGLSGIFINEGPLVILKNNLQKLQVLKDFNRGTIFDLPMLILVNGLSASASELLASTLKDYNRAVIVGNTTYGKATGQNILPLDSTINNFEVKKSPYGLIKITLDKLYRITGKSIQAEGLPPDISLPDVYQNLNPKENQNDFYLPNDSIYKKLIYNPLSHLPIEKLSANSNKRISNNSTFEKINLSNSNFPEINEKLWLDIPLSPLPYKERFYPILSWYKNLGNITDIANKDFTVENCKSNQDLLKIDAFQMEFDQKIRNNILKDVYIYESYHIITDLIYFNSNSKK